MHEAGEHEGHQHATVTMEMDVVVVDTQLGLHEADVNDDLAVAIQKCVAETLPDRQH